MKYLVENNLDKGTEFLQSKGYNMTKNNVKKKSRVYKVTFKGNTESEVSMRADGRKIFLEIETNNISQYTMIYNSIAPYLVSSGVGLETQVFNVKELGTIYILSRDGVPYGPLNKYYDIHLTADKGITSLN
jgi:tRNA threonylcarbamoyladenosine modification (KEOPS) complex  Pcc1 subunit